MTPQGSNLIDVEYFNNMTRAINAASTCEELQALVDESFKSLASTKKAIQEELAKIAPMLALLTPPTSLGAIISWVKTFITSYLTPMVKPYLTYASQLTAMLAQIAALTAAIENAAKRLTSCQIKIPPL